jgi:hypothetical protein
MTYNWILNYSSPTTIVSGGSVANLSFLRKILVVIKGEEDTQDIITLTQKTTTPELLFLNAAFDGGLNSISYIIKSNLNLSLLPITDNYFTIFAKGFSELEIESKDLGSYDGVFFNHLSSGFTGTLYNEGWCRDSTGYTTLFTLSSLLSQPSWVNIPYRTSNANLEFVENSGDANLIYDNYGTGWGKDDESGLRLISFFINKQSPIKPYIYKEISQLIKANDLTLMSKDVKYTKGSARAVEQSSAALIESLYVSTGIIESFEISVVLSPNGKEFNANLSIEVPESVWKINFLIQGE